MIKYLLLLITLLPMGLEAQEEGFYVFGRQEIIPTSMHETIYQMMEECSGIEGDFDAVNWAIANYIVIGDPSKGLTAAALWDPAGRQIILSREYAFDGSVISHEVLHDLYEGKAPMDIAESCILDWSILRHRR